MALEKEIKPNTYFYAPFVSKWMAHRDLPRVDELLLLKQHWSTPSFPIPRQRKPCLTSKTASCAEYQDPKVLGCNAVKRDGAVILTNTSWKTFSVLASENEKIQYRSVYSNLCEAAGIFDLPRRRLQGAVVWWKIWAGLKNNIPKTGKCLRKWSKNDF